MAEFCTLRGRRDTALPLPGSAAAQMLAPSYNWVFLVFGEPRDKFGKGPVHARGAELRHRVRAAAAREQSRPCRTFAA